MGPTITLEDSETQKYMQKINKKSFINIIVLCVIVVFSYLAYVLFTMMSNKAITTRSSAEITNELDYAENSRAESQKFPYIGKLPIKTEAYTVLYSSLSKSIVVIFNREQKSVRLGKERYSEEINKLLSSIGVDINNTSISWELSD